MASRVSFLNSDLILKLSYLKLSMHSHCSKHKAIFLSIGGKVLLIQALSFPCQPQLSPHSCHYFCSSHTDLAWPVSLMCHALSHFLIVPAPTVFRPFPGQDFQPSFICPLFTEAFTDCFQVWILYPFFAIPWNV